MKTSGFELGSTMFADGTDGFGNIDSMLNKLDGNTDVDKMTSAFARTFKVSQKPAGSRVVDEEGARIRRKI